MSARLRHAAIELKDANAYVAALHRHHLPVLNHRFSVCALRDGDFVCGVVIVGRPVARARQDGRTVEVTRLCTDGTANACSFLYGAAARAAFAIGWRRIGTYILQREPGTSLIAAGWTFIHETRGGTWDRGGRRRIDNHPTQPKKLFERVSA